MDSINADYMLIEVIVDVLFLKCYPVIVKREVQEWNSEYKYRFIMFSARIKIQHPLSELCF